MSLESIFFFVSLAALILMVGLKWGSLQNGSEGILTRSLAPFDEPIRKALINTSTYLKRVILLGYRYTSVFFHTLHHILAAYLHNMVRAAERQVRNWREFARERKIENNSTSVFLKDMTEYKNQLKENNHEV
ncbi:MAG: hypothetical protein A3C06_03245 [Candidatus Taylorbacteria bacterium RIFCSPHIGHO2_02_FULL_46_13]|uniref:Uncharacterized protein n=1 Tax=Candidatus Taylorbacteria bacterium RIFCSPHIGHO2_02_FULL_46_13 TaxID=1802312 RepID=A0A1G2MRS4_9BACT|nr:MAG: hypothetical protein A3C06_03245 [Candidatus Taylorbacteria bacterium RIFCSPHIGHO2_02_FULL_46_13]